MRVLVACEIMIEIDKCALVCVRCHREIHAGITVL